MTALICGSIAYDTILVFPDRFKNHILPDNIHMLNVCFVTPEMRREFGGCAGNIAYSLKLLGGDGLAMGTAGQDFKPYAEWMDQNGIDRRHVTVIEEEYTAQALITTDLDDNQITAFHLGAMGYSYRNKVSDATGITIGIAAPDGRDGTIQHAQQFAEAGIPFIFDPGQNIPRFDSEELSTFIDQATWVVVNDYEWQLIQNKTGLTPHDVAERAEALIITRGAEGSVIYTKDKRHDIPAATAEKVEDPTGCGDAHRAGILYGLMNDMDWETTGRVGSLMGAIKIAHHGTQNHVFGVQEFADRFEESFGFSL